MLYYKYLDDEKIKGFEKYKYNSIDTSPLSNYVMHPFWNQCVKLFPNWIAPNTMTVTGFVLLVINGLLLTFYDYNFTASSNNDNATSPIPSWVWLIVAINHFLAHNLDGIDGKQARRTGTSGPLGELMDHGLDSWASFLVPFAAYSIFGIGSNSYPPLRVLFIFWTVFITFYLSHWEKYNTGILYLPWSYDITQLALFTMYLVTYNSGYLAWKEPIPALGLSVGQLFEPIAHFGSFGLSIPVTIYNVYLAYRGGMLKRTPWEGFRPLISFITLFVSTTTWAYYSANDVVAADPRMFYCLVGTVFSQIACRLIVNQMSSTRCETLNWFLYPIILATVLVLKVNVFTYHEVALLRILTVFFVVAHVHYGVCIVKQMCDHFGINCFSVTKRTKNGGPIKKK